MTGFNTQWLREWRDLRHGWFYITSCSSSSHLHQTNMTAPWSRQLIIYTECTGLVGGWYLTESHWIQMHLAHQTHMHLLVCWMFELQPQTHLWAWSLIHGHSTYCTMATLVCWMNTTGLFSTDHSMYCGNLCGGIYWVEPLCYGLAYIHFVTTIYIGTFT